MSAISQSLVSCPVSQADIAQAWQDGVLGGTVENMPLAEFILSPVNRRDIAMTISPGAGKVRNVQLTYMPRLLESGTQSNVNNPNCGTGNVLGDRSTTYTLDTDVNYASTTFSVTAGDLEAACQSNGDYWLKVIMRQIDQLDRKMATVIANQVAASYGTWGSGLFTTGNAVGNVNSSSEFVTQTLLSGGTSIYPLGWQKLNNALNKIGFQQAAIFGGETLLEYFQATQTGCCTDSGIDVSAQLAQYGRSVSYDRRLVASTALNSDLKAMALVPGALQWVGYTRSPWKVGMNVEQAGNYYHAVVVSPRLGIEYDWTLVDNCGTVSSTVVCTGKTIAMPTDMYITGDLFDGVTGAAKILVTNP